MKLRKELMLALIFISLASIIYSLEYDDLVCGRFCYLIGIDGQTTLTNNPQPVHAINMEPAGMFEPVLDKTYFENNNLDKVVEGASDFTAIINDQSNPSFDQWIFNFTPSTKRLTNGKYVFNTVMRYVGTGIELPDPFEYNYTIDITPPKVDPTDGHSGFVFNQDGIETDIIQAGDNVSIRAKITDFDGSTIDLIEETSVKQANVTVNDINYTLQGPDQDNTYSVLIRNLDVGDYNGRFLAYDNLSDFIVGNLDGTVNFTFAIQDTIIPGISLIAPIEGYSTVNNPDIEIATTENSTCDLYYEDGTFIGSTDLNKTHVFEQVIINEDPNDPQSTLLNVTCNDRFNNENSTILRIIFLTIVPEITLASSRGTSISTYYNGKITSLDTTANTPVRCRYKGGEKPFPEPTYASMIPFDDQGLNEIHVQDITDDIETVGTANNFTFFVACEDIVGYKTEEKKSVNITVDIELGVIATDPIGVIGNQYPTLFVELNKRAKCKYNNTNFIPYQNEFTHTATIGPLEEANHTYEIMCTQTEFPTGIIAYENLSFEIDLTPPGLYVDASVPSRTISNIVDITGYYTEKNRIQNILVNGENTTINKTSKRYNITLSLADGENTVLIGGYDGVGNYNHTTKTIIVDNEGPSFLDLDQIESPTSNPTLIISGTTEASAKVELFKSGIYYGAAFANPKETEYEIPRFLFENAASGTNLMKFLGDFVSQFSSGRFVQDHNSFDRYEIQYSVNSGPYTFVYLISNLPQTVVEGSQIHVYNTSMPEGRFTLPGITLDVGNNDNIGVHTYDDLNNLGISKITSVILDLTEPSITPQIPLDGEKIGDNQTIIKALITDSDALINESSIILDIKGECEIHDLNIDNHLEYQNGITTFEISNNNLCNLRDQYLDGDYNVTINVSDSVGNKKSRKWTFTIDTNVSSIRSFNIIPSIEKQGIYFSKDISTISIEFNTDVMVTSVTLYDIATSDPIHIGDQPTEGTLFDYIPDNMADGKYRFEITARKKLSATTYGVPKTFRYDIVIDNKPPLVNIEHILAHGYNYNENITLLISAVDEDSFVNESSTSLTIVGIDAWVMNKQLGGEYNYTIPGLSVGEYEIRYYAADIVKNENISVNETLKIVDALPPFIYNETPSGMIKQKPSEINATIEDPSGVDDYYITLNTVRGISTSIRNNVIYMVPPENLINNGTGDTGKNDVLLFVNDTLGNEIVFEWSFYVNSEMSEANNITLGLLDGTDERFIQNHAFVNYSDIYHTTCIGFTTPTIIIESELDINGNIESILEIESRRETNSKYCYWMNNGVLIQGDYIVSLTSDAGRDYLIVFTVDRTKPVVQIDPDVPLKTNNNYVNITGSYTEDNIHYITLDGENATTNDTNRFNVTIYLNGEENITIGAYDKAGNREITHRVFEFNQTIPSITNLTIEPRLTNKTTNITFNASENLSSIDIKLTNSVGTEIGGTLQLEYQNKTYYKYKYTAPDTQISDEHAVNITFTDLYGNENYDDSILLSIDNIPPRVYDFMPPNDTTIADSTTEVSALIDDWIGVNTSRTIMILDEEEVVPDVISSSAISYTPVDEFEEGVHNVILNVTDHAGNKRIAEWHFEIDSNAPSSPEISPEGFTNNSMPLIKVDFDDTETIAIDLIELDGQIIGENIAANHFSHVPATALDETEHKIEVRARRFISPHWSGQGYYRQTFTVDITKPNISISDDVTNLTSSTTLQITGNCTDNLANDITIEVYVNGTWAGFVQCVNRGYTIDVLLNDNSQNLVNVSAIDEADNVNNVLKIVEVDSIAPDIQITNIINEELIFDQEPYRTNKENVTIEASYYDINFDNIEIENNGIPIAPEMNSENNQLTMNITLDKQDGEEYINEITIAGIDLLGLRGEANTTIISDFAGPDIVSTKPETLSTIFTSPELNITTNEYANCTVKYISSSGAVYKHNFTTSNHTYHNVTLNYLTSDVSSQEGNKTALKIDCTDKLDNNRSHIVNITVDKVTPLIVNLDVTNSNSVILEASERFVKYLIYQDPLTKIKTTANEAVLCRYSATQTDYSQMENEFDNDFNITKTTEMIPLSTDNRFFVSCTDKADNIAPYWNITIIYNETYNVPIDIIKPINITNEIDPNITVSTKTIESDCYIDYLGSGVGEDDMARELTNGIYNHHILSPDTDAGTLADGLHEFNVRCEPDTANLVDNQITVSFEVDTAGPAKPIIDNLTSPVNVNTITVTGESELNTTVLVYINGSYSGRNSTTMSNNRFEVTDVILKEGRNNITAIAIDLAGNIGNKSDSVFVVYTEDAPVLITTHPADKEVKNKVHNITAIFDLYYDIPINISMSLINLSREGITIGGSLSNSSNNVLVFTPSQTLTNGTYNISVYATDIAGNIGQTNYSIFRINNNSPDIRLISPIKESTLTSNITIFNGTINSTVEGAVIVDSTLGIDGIEYSLELVDGAFNISLFLEDGTYDFNITALSSAGVYAVDIGTITIDTTGPGGCIIVDDEGYCTAAGTPAYGGFGAYSNVVCGDDSCDYGDICISDCVLRDIPGYETTNSIIFDYRNTDGSEAIATSEPFVIYAQGYSKEDILFTGAVVVTEDDHKAELILNQSLNASLITFSKINYGTNKVYESDYSVMWKSDNKVVGADEKSRITEASTDLIYAYLEKYPSTLT